MDGTLAIIFVVAGLTEMQDNFCPTGCFARNDAPARVTVQAGELIYNTVGQGTEVYLGYDLGFAWGPFQPTVAVSATQGETYWAGAGFKWTSERLMPGPLFIESALLVGAQTPGDGLDLGSPLQFRTSLGAGFKWGEGSSITAIYDHRSNGDVAYPNPGIETLTLRYAHAF